jgi:Tfp pilus assembly protein PilX
MKNRKNLGEQLNEDQKGMMVVEAVLTFTVFLMVVIAIIYLITIFTVHNKIQFSINSSAHEIASYSYLYQALGLRGAEQKINADGSSYTQPIDDTATQVVDSINKIQGLYTDGQDTLTSLQELELSPEAVDQAYQQAETMLNNVGDTADSIQQSVTDVTNLFSDPNSLMVGMIYMGASAGSYTVKSIGATAAAAAVTKKYLDDDYLLAYGVKNGYSGLDFSGSTMFCDEDMRLIDIVVQYDIDLKFIGLIMPEDSLHVVQRVTVPAWLDGDGIYYEP